MHAKHTYTFPKPPAVVVGVCAHGLATLRALAGREIPLLVLDSDASLPGAATALATFERVADINGHGLLEALLDLRARIECPGLPVLFLINDNMVASLGASAHRLAGKYHLSWSHCRERLLPLLEKSVLGAWARRQGLDYPVTVVVRSEADVQRALDTTGFPCIVKPVRPLSGFKTFQPKTLAEFRRWTEAHRDDLPFIAQRYIPGDERTIHFAALYLDRGRVLARYEGRKLRSYPPGHTTVAESLPDDEIHRLAVRFFEGLELSGPVSLELKRCPDGGLWVIEPTVGRTDFWVDLCTANGVNLPLMEYCHQVGEPLPEGHQTDRAVWFNEERDPFGRSWFATRRGLRMNGRRSVYLYLDHRDPGPAKRALVGIAAGLGRQIARWLARGLTGRGTGPWGSATLRDPAPAAATGRGRGTLPGSSRH